MNEKINRIINELVQLDPDFAKHQGELEKILSNLLAIKPEPVIDSVFVHQLKVQLQQEAANNHRNSSAWSRFRTIFMNRTFVPATAVAVVLLVAIVSWQVFPLKNPKNPTGLGSDVRITRASERAFGDLAKLTVTNTTTDTKNAVAPLGADVARSSIAYGDAGGEGTTSMIAPYPYEFVTYKYVYKGEALNLNSSKLDVLKKQSPDTGTIISGLNSLGLGLMNLDSFPGSKIQSVSFNQDNGYNIYVDLVSGMVSISSSYADVVSMNTTNQLCPMEGCPTPPPVAPIDIPDDQSLIAIANNFLSEHGISTTAYGSPEVVDENRFGIMALEKTRSSVYYPDFINVIYPFKVQQEQVYDESGNKMGLTVGVSVRSHKVTSVWNLSTQDYQASSYDAETDAARILKVAENGGMYGYGYYMPEGGKTVEVQLGTPTLQYVNMWDYQMNSSQQMLVPSLVFPIIQQPEDGQFYRKAVVVPLIKDILNRNTYKGDVPSIKPMMEPTGSPGVAE